MHKTQNASAVVIVIVQQIINALEAKITQYGLEVLTRYPDDLYKHDRAMLERHAHPGAKIAWMVGHCHTHFCVLGVHPDENVGVTYLTNLASEDRFFVINVGQESHRLSEMNRDAFKALATTPVPFKASGSATSYYLSNKGRRIGHVALEPVGGWQDRSYRVLITPVAGIMDADHSALEIWAAKSVVKVSGSLFTRFTIEWQTAVLLLQAA